MAMWSAIVALLLVQRVVADANPFALHPFYLNPENQKSYDRSIETASHSLVKSNLAVMRNIASAYWIDKKDKIRGNGTRTVHGILADAAAKPIPELVVLIWYDFPNRDCAAAASAGEICCAYNADGSCNWGAGGDCADGIREYRTTYVDPFVEVLSEFKGRVPVVIIFEPDSLPNFATNLDKPHCGSLETRRAYTEGAKYALTQLTSETDAIVYIDAAHGGWLGWHNNLMTFISTLKELEVPLDKIRGFSTNVAGYQPLGHLCPWAPDSSSEPYRNGYCLNHKHQHDPCCADACGLLGQWDPAQNELNYAQELHHAAKGELGMDAHVVIDTGRNGVPDERSDCASWCNNRGAGAGHVSSAQTEALGFVDAYFYLKTPGESDGCTQQLPDGTPCPRFDTACGSADSIGSRAGEARAPEAGQWFDYQVKQLAELASFGDSSRPPTSSASESTTTSTASSTASSTAPSTASPRTSPTPSPVLESEPTGQGQCCWGPNCDASPESWCRKSKSNCEGACNGKWSAQQAPALASTNVKSNPQKGKKRRHSFLAPGLENMMLQMNALKRRSTEGASPMHKADRLGEL